MNPASFSEFESDARAQGFDQVVERRWQPGQVVGAHSHPFLAQALVVDGEMWLSVGGETRHLVPGDTFRLESGTTHDERYGPQGATYWVARRSDPAAPG